MKTVSIALTAGQSLDHHIAGDFFHLLETSGAMTIKFLQNGAEKDEAIDMEFGFFVKPEGGFTALRFYSATSQTIKIAVGFGNGGYNRTVGEVQVSGQAHVIVDDPLPDASEERSLAGGAFLVGKYKAPVAGRYPRVSLFNPVASTKTVFIEALTLAVGGATSTVQVAGLSAAIGGAGVAGVNKFIGGAVSSALIYSDDVASIAGLVPLLIFDIATSGAIGFEVLNFKGPIVLPPGAGVVVCGDLGMFMESNFEYYEK